MSASVLVAEEGYIVSAICDELKGPVSRYVYPLRLSRENIQRFWYQASKFPTVFTDEIKGDFQKFCELFLSSDEETGKIVSHGLFWVVDDFVGIYNLTHITEFDAVAHYTFFDRRQTGRQELTREMLRYVFKRFGFRRLSTEVPKYVNKHTVGFVEEVGFKYEGCKRKAAHYKGDWFDVRQFGILREEILTDAE